MIESQPLPPRADRYTKLRAAVRRQVARGAQKTQETWRSLERRYWPGARGTVVITAGVVAVVLVLTALIVFAQINWWSTLDRVCKKNDLGCHLGSHLFVDLLLAGIGYWFFLRREARAARSWRRAVRREPERLFVDWLPNPDGLTGEAATAASPGKTGAARRRGRGDLLPPIAKTAKGRDHLVKAIEDDLNETGDAQVLVGESGSGKTTVLLLLACDLAKQGQVPVAITLRGETTKDIEKRAREAFIARVTEANQRSRTRFRRARARNHDEAEKWWNWLRLRSLITVLVDDLERSALSPPMRVQALERAAHQNLRMIAASGRYGLPPDYRRGRTEIDRLDCREVIADLKEIVDLSRSAADPGPSDKEIEDLVARAAIGRTPYYMAIARVLAARGLFPRLTAARDPRVALLDSYREGLVTRALAPAAGLSQKTRETVLNHLEAVAFVCIADVQDEQEVARRATALRAEPPEMPYPELFDLARRLTILESRYDGQIHFAHPTTLAYFAARFVRTTGCIDSWTEELAACPRLRPIVITALTLAVAGDDQMVRSGCRVLLRWLASHSSSGFAYESDELTQERLGLSAAAAEMLATMKEPDSAIVSRVAELARHQSVVGGRLIAEKKRIVAALAKLGAYDQLWSYARERQEYPVRREASGLLVDPRNADGALIANVKSVIQAAVAESKRKPRHLDDKMDLIVELTPVAWMLPSLRVAWPKDLDALQEQLIEVSVGEDLTVQRGLEASVAQGFKLAAHRHLGHADRYVKVMLESRPTFWFSRVMLLQALAFQCFTRADAYSPQGDRSDIRKSLREAREDPHPFVQETARLCELAIKTGRWDHYIWRDTTEIVTGIPQELHIEAAQLVGDIVIALNLNANAHDDPRKRKCFGEANELPACLGPRGSRDIILGRASPPTRCALDARSEDERMSNEPARCACPYLYHSTDLKIDARRELSRAFCRHQRTNSRPLRWQPDLDPNALKKFWDGMEMLARF